MIVYTITKSIRLPMKFNEKKTSQMAALLLTMRGGRMSYMKLIKLLYFVDREALIRFGRPITNDRYVSMDHGPVLSKTYSLMVEGQAFDESSYWTTHISEPIGNKEVKLLQDPGTDELSESEVELAKEVFRLYGHLNRWDVVNITHELPEWEDPQGSSIPIHYKDILQFTNKTPTEIAAIIHEMNHSEAASRIFSED